MGAGPSDKATWPLPERRGYGFTRAAQYVTMKDGVRLATYLFRPTGVPNEKVGTIVIPTPYFSLAAFRSPHQSCRDLLVQIHGGQ